jgi:hypothetical protein
LVMAPQNQILGMFSTSDAGTAAQSAGSKAGQKAPQSQAA